MDSSGVRVAKVFGVLDITPSRVVGLCSAFAWTRSGKMPPSSLDLKGVAVCEFQLPEIPQRTARRSATATLDKCGGRGVFDTVEYNAQRIAIDADNLKAALN